MSVTEAYRWPVGTAWAAAVVLAGSTFLSAYLGAPSAGATTTACITIYGTPGNDTQNGTGGCDIYWGYAGNDTFYALAGNDELHMGAGYDTGFGQDNTDVLYGGAENDNLRGGNGPDTLSDVETNGQRPVEWV